MAGNKSEVSVAEVFPEIEAVIGALPADLADSETELRARVRLAFHYQHLSPSAAEIEAATDVLRARAAGATDSSPFGKRIRVDSYEALADAADRLVADGRLDMAATMSLLFESGAIAAAQGRRLILFLGLNAAIRRALWEGGTTEIERRGLGSEWYHALGRMILLWSEMSTMAIGEGYRATERELIARDAAARRAALDELLGITTVERRTIARIRRLAMRFGLDPDATYRVAAVRPAPEADPTPDEPGLDEADLEALAGRIDQLLRRSKGRGEGPGRAINVPCALTWRGSIVAILSSDLREWGRLQGAVKQVFGPGSDAPTWTAIATPGNGVRDLARAMVELQEGLRVAEAIGRTGVIDDLAELGIERLLLSDPELAATIVERELGALLADRRMGDELVETLQVFFDAGGNRRETARRMHLADRTVAYRLDRAEDLLGHGLDGDAGRRLNVALTLRRLEDPGGTTPE